MKIGRKLVQVTPFLVRHLVARNLKPYERILQYVKERGDIWLVSQREYIAWWMKRENADLRITVSEGKCYAHSSLENAVIEKFPGEMLETPTALCPEATFSGTVWITVDSALEKKELLIEMLKREGILNYRIAERGEFMISTEDVGDLLDEIDSKLQQGRIKVLEADVRAIRQIVIDKLAKHRLPLLRIWYHPRVNGVAVRSVFSPRFDVDRAITNLARIRNLEMKYDVSSTLYLRAFCPFYSDDAIKKVLSLPGHPEIALHGEFITHARKYGDEMTAAVAEKEHLEQLTGLPVLGIAMHGGELAFNKSKNTDDAIQNAGLLYNTTIGPTDYYFPYRKVVDGQVSKCYTLPHALSDFRLLPFKPTRRVVNGHVHKSYSLSTLLKAVSFSSIRDYNRMFYEKTIERIDEVYEQNGVFVFTLHPAYFGFLSYLANPKNLILLLKFSLNYFKRSR